MIDLRYQKAKIYTIRSHLTDRVYVGSTRTTLSKRFGKHKSSYKSYKNGKGKKVMVYDLFAHDPNCYIELHEYYPCNNREELNKREGQVTRKLNYVNKRIEGRTRQQYRIDNRQRLSAYDKQYRIDNREQILAYQKQYQKQSYNCECGSTFSVTKKARHLRTKKHRKWVLNAHNCFNHL